MPHPAAELKALSIAHQRLTAPLRAVTEALRDRLESGSRDYEALQLLLNEYISLQHAADVVSGQVKAGSTHV